MVWLSQLFLWLVSYTLTTSIAIALGIFVLTSHFVVLQIIYGKQILLATPMKVNFSMWYTRPQTISFQSLFYTLTVVAGETGSDKCVESGRGCLYDPDPLEACACSVALQFESPRTRWPTCHYTVLDYHQHLKQHVNPLKCWVATTCTTPQITWLVDASPLLALSKSLLHQRLHTWQYRH